MSRYLVTAALPYANGPVHIGHLAGCYIPADIYVRYLRLRGEDVKFICGSDEHGVPITIKAKNEGITPQQVVDKYHKMMGDSFKEFGISFDIYSRTSNNVHHETAQDFFKSLYNKGVFEEIVSEQFYDEEAKQFLADRYIVGTCPKCGNENAYGDQCENCGSSLQPTDLINPKSKLSGAKPVMKATKNWYLPMNKIQQSKEFNEYIKRFADWKPNIKGQCESWLKEGLQPRAMTRDLDWGVKVPLADAEGKVLYVWFDAPIGYISATKELFLRDEGRGANEKEINSDWKKYWLKQKDENDNTKLIHFIGKDNIVFHAIIFPMMLMQHGEFILPTNVPANEFLNLEGDKISTSRNWAVWLHEYLKDFPDRQDELRYVLTSIAPETKDSDFSWKDYQTRVNSELGDILGNYIKRVVDLINMFFYGIVPTWQNSDKGLSDEERYNLDIKPFDRARLISNKISEFKFREALFDVVNAAREGNQYLQENAPWKTIKTDRAIAGNVLLVSFNKCIELASLIQPFLPKTSERIYKMLNIDSKNYSLYNNPNSDLPWPVQPYPYNDGHKISTSEILFPKITDEEIEKQITKLHATKTVSGGQLAVGSKKADSNSLSFGEGKGEATFDDFSKMDLRIATIVEAERVPKTDKLLKLKIDLGFEQRTIVSGIAHCFEPEKIIGQQVTIIANLAPRKIKGIESKGMILMAENADGKLKFVMPSEKIINGSAVK